MTKKEFFDLLFSFNKNWFEFLFWIVDIFSRE
jgi:hypothetical protein